MPTSSSAFHLGDRVWYVIDGIGASPAIWARAVVVRVSPSRVAVYAALGHRRARSVAPYRLVAGWPPANVKALDFSPGFIDALFQRNRANPTWARIARLHARKQARIRSSGKRGRIGSIARRPELAPRGGSETNEK